jgi:3-oxoadipate enol-lactonase
MTRIATDFVPGTPRLAYDHAGAGKVAVFLHGIGGNRTNWTDQVMALAPRFRAVAWDARGYGRSDDYAGKLDFGDFAHDLVRLLDHLAVEKAFVVGLSMGGRIAQDFYARHPARVAALVLVATVPSFGASLTPAQREEFVRLRKQPLVEGKEPKDIAPVVARTLVSKNCPPAVYERLVASMTALHKESYIKTVEATVYYDRSADLPNIKVPTRLIFGDEDTLTKVSVGQEMERKIPGARLSVYEKCGHLVNLEAPERFNAEILDFLLHHEHLAR